jgi:hypothetical protein
VLFGKQLAIGKPRIVNGWLVDRIDPRSNLVIQQTVKICGKTFCVACVSRFRVSNDSWRQETFWHYLSPINGSAVQFTLGKSKSRFFAVDLGVLACWWMFERDEMS